MIMNQIDTTKDLIFSYMYICVFHKKSFIEKKIILHKKIKIFFFIKRFKYYLLKLLENAHI